MEKKDYKKIYQQLYKPKKGVIQLVEVPPLAYLMVDGQGNPNTPVFQNALQLLYTMSYTLKFLAKEAGTDYIVMPSEGLWYGAEHNDFSMQDKSDWHWTAMIMQPDSVTKEMIEIARNKVKVKKPKLLVDNVRYEIYDEGYCVQTLYVGSYDLEHETIMLMHQHALQHGYVLNGKHHEIYLSDPRRTTPEKNRTILRQPIRKIH